MKTFRKLILPAMVCLGLATLTGCRNNNTKIVNEFETIINDGEDQIISRGINIKKLITGVDANNHAYKTYSYTIYPETPVYKDVSATITFADNRTASSYLTCSVDSVNQTFTITCLQAFDSVATLTLSADIGGASCSMTVNYSQKVSSISFDSSTTHFYKYATDVYTPPAGGAYGSAYEIDAGLNLNRILKQLFTINKSVYTTQPFSETEVYQYSGQYDNLPSSAFVDYRGSWGATLGGQHAGSYIASALAGLDMSIEMNSVGGGAVYYTTYKSAPVGVGAEDPYGSHKDRSIYAALSYCISNLQSSDKAYLYTLLDNQGNFQFNIDLTNVTCSCGGISTGTGGASIVLHVEPLDGWIPNHINSIQSEESNIVF